MKRIELNVNKTISSLAGNSYGRECFEKFVKEVDYNEEYEIVFPTHILYIATSFIQGFFDEFVQVDGVIGIQERVEIKSKIPNLKDIIIDSLL